MSSGRIRLLDHGGRALYGRTRTMGVWTPPENWPETDRGVGGRRSLFGSGRAGEQWESCLEWPGARTRQPGTRRPKTGCRYSIGRIPGRSPIGERLYCGPGPERPSDGHRGPHGSGQNLDGRRDSYGAEPPSRRSLLVFRRHSDPRRLTMADTVQVDEHLLREHPQRVRVTMAVRPVDATHVRAIE